MNSIREKEGEWIDFIKINLNNRGFLDYHHSETRDNQRRIGYVCDKLLLCGFSNPVFSELSLKVLEGPVLNFFSGKPCFRSGTADRLQHNDDLSLKWNINGFDVQWLIEQLEP